MYIAILILLIYIYIYIQTFETEATYIHTWPLLTRFRMNHYAETTK